MMKIFLTPFYWLLALQLCAIMSLAGITAFAEPADHKAEDIINRVRTTYEKVRSASGRITRIVKSGYTKPRKFTGEFIVKNPDYMIIDFEDNARQLIGFDGDSYRVFSPDENKGFFKDVHDMTPLERFLLGSEPVFGHVLKLIEHGFSIEVAYMFRGNIVLKSTPCLNILSPPNPSSVIFTSLLYSF